VTLSNYRWRLGLEKGERKYDSYEQKLATLPNITVPTITIEGGNNGRRIRHRRPTRVNLPVNMNTAPLGQPWVTIRLRKIRRISSTVVDADKL
jgi:hypothetical protein